MRLNYAIKYVSDMDRAIAFYRDTLGFELKFASPFWSEFATGDTTLALHPASDDNAAGSVELGFAVDNLREFYNRREELGLHFTRPRRCTGSTSRASATWMVRKPRSAAPSNQSHLISVPRSAPRLAGCRRPNIWACCPIFHRNCGRRRG